MHSCTPLSSQLVPPSDLPKTTAAYDALTESQKRIYDNIRTQALSPPNPTYCLARVYFGARQCSHKPLSGDHELFCRMHCDLRARMKHGLQGQELPADNLHQRVMVEMRARLRTGKVQWYSRDLFWDELQKLAPLDDVVAFSDEQYMEALYRFR